MLNLSRRGLLLWWVWSAVAVTLVLFVVYAVVQQVYRQGLNDPQIQMAEDAVLSLQQGAAPADIVSLSRAQTGAAHTTSIVDIAQSLAPWLVVYDANGQVLENTGQLDNAPPKLPSGVFDTSTWLAHPNGLFYNQSPIFQTRFTWQPQPGVRQAIVLAQTPDHRYFVAAGRNMREVEQRIEHLGEMIFLGWAATLGAMLILGAAVWVSARQQKRGISA